MDFPIVNRFAGCIGHLSSSLWKHLAKLRVPKPYADTMSPELRSIVYNTLDLDPVYIFSSSIMVQWLSMGSAAFIYTGELSINWRTDAGILCNPWLAWKKYNRPSLEGSTIKVYFVSTDDCCSILTKGSNSVELREHLVSPVLLLTACK